MAARLRIRLVHWKEEEVPERADRLAAEGFEVDGEVPGTSIGVRQLRQDPPTAVVIDLGRLPSHGREVARALRQAQGLREIPIVFVDGAPGKVEAVRAEFPDAAYAEWGEIGPALRGAIAAPPVDPVVPESDSGSRSGRPLAEKLGIKAGSTLVLVDAPDGIETTLAPLPADVALRRANRGLRAMTLWFVTERRQLDRRFEGVATAVGEGILWVAWPKRTSGVESDLGEDAVREVALAHEMVDTKVCAIDATWSGLRLTRRRRRPS
jgi:CheY-like chemotaxis protein